MKESLETARGKLEKIFPNEFQESSSKKNIHSQKEKMRGKWKLVSIK